MQCPACHQTYDVCRCALSKSRERTRQRTIAASPLPIRSAVEEALEQVRVALGAAAEDARALAVRVSEAAERYRAEVERECANRVLRAASLPVPQPADVEGAALALAALVEALPELRALRQSEQAAMPAAPAQDSEPERMAAEVIPLLPPPHGERARAPSSHGDLVVPTLRALRLLVVSGDPPRKELDWLRGDCGLAGAEWIHTPKDGGDGAVRRVAERLQQGKAGAVLIFSIGHKKHDVLRAAAQRGNVPFYYSPGGSRGAMVEALRALEKRLGAAAAS